MCTVEGLIVVVAVLAAATAVGLWRRRVDGTLRAHRSADVVLTSDDLGHPLGDRVTFVQFSTAFCQPCRANRHVLGHVAGADTGVAHIDVDAESHLDLVRRLGVTRTPTTLVLDAQGVVRQRATGALRLDEARAAVVAVTEL